MVERQQQTEVMALLRVMLVSVSLTTLTFLAILFVFSAASVLCTFELYPHDSAALFFIEVVLALLAASTAGVLYAHQHYQR
jgi:hypothetical protein